MPAASNCPADAPIGMDAREYMGETILDLELTPNRPDCLCVTGVAREVASLTGAELTLPDVDYAEEETPVEALAKVTIDENGIQIHDTQSPYGLAVNDDRVPDKGPLRNGDVVWLGDAAGRPVAAGVYFVQLSVGGGPGGTARVVITR